MRLIQNGFSLIEVLVALVMVSITITSLMTMQSTLQKMLYGDTSQWKAEQLAVQAFAKADRKEPLEPGNTFEEEQDGFKTVYAVTKIAESSSLTEIKELVSEKVTVSWTRIFGAQDYKLVRFSYRQKQPEKKEKDKNAVAPEAPAQGVETKPTGAKP